MNTNLTEDIFDAINIIASAKLQEISYDKTVRATIIDISDKDNGHYIVSDGSIKFDAYSESTKYRVDDVVRISIPNGDFSQKKYIEGKYVTDDYIKPITYVSPLESVLDVTSNILPEEIANATYGLITNDIITEVPIWSAELRDSAWADLQNNGIYNTLFIKADFQSLLASYDMRSGDYGLVLELYIRGENGEGFIIHKATLSVEDMFGSPYSFLVYSTQEKKFDVTNLGTVEKLRLYFYQKDNFTHYDGRSTTRLDAPDFHGIYNLLVKNLYVGFGSELSTIDDNQFKLYTTGDNIFRIDNAPESNEKQLGLLWYNKSEDNKYIGFSDGLYDPRYDELTYLKESEYDTRLTSQLGRKVPEDEIGLTLSADIAEMVPLVADMRTIMTRELKTAIRGFQDRIAQVEHVESAVESEFDKILDSETGLLAVTAKRLEAFSENLSIYYNTNLENAYNKFLSDNEKTYAYISYTSIKDSNTPLEDLNWIYNTFYNALYNAQGNPLPISMSVIANIYTGFQGIYDSYAIRINKILNEILLKLNRCLELLGAEYTNWLQQYFKISTAPNKYVKENFDNYHGKYCIYWYRYESGYVDPKERFMSKEWKFLPEMTNKGLPEQAPESAYMLTKPTGDAALHSFMMDGARAIEKFAVVMFYNHEMFKSNIIEFINQDRVPDDTTLDAADAIMIEHGEFSQDSYQLYNIDNELVDSADAYRKRKLKLTYQGQINGDEALIGAQIYWYIPNQATMITWAQEDLQPFTDDLSSLGDGPKSEHYREGFTCFYRTIGADENGQLKSEDRYFTYRIKNYLVATSSNNIIYCKVVKGEYVFETELLLYFGTFGTSGTNYILTIQPSTTQCAIDMFKEPDAEAAKLPLSVHLYDHKNEEIDIVYDTNGDKTKATGLELHLLGPTGYFLFGGQEKSDDGIEPGQKVSKVWFSPNLADGSFKATPDTCLYGCGEVIAQFAIPQLTEEEKAAGDTQRVINLTTFYPVALRWGDYYIEGASTVVYTNAGGTPSYYKKPYRIFDNTTDKEITNVTWKISYYDGKGQSVKADSLEMSYAPTLNKDNCLKPSVVYLEGADMYPVVTCWQGNKILWAQSILLMQNRYPSAMLNEWDGSFQIDEKNGTIMSTMVGAGRKNSNNQFEGILMGDVQAAAGFDPDKGTGNGNGIGIYGFHDGAQSFAFLADGTGFIGKSGCGRIVFNGDKGQIGSAGYWGTGATKTGMLIDMDDGFISIYRSGKQRILIDQNSPYLIINSSNDNRLLHIANNNYYLQSDNYVFDTSGMKIDLDDGHIDAHDFKLTTGTILIDSNGPTIKVESPTDYGPLFEITDSSFALRSPDGKVTLTSFGSNNTDRSYFRINNGSIDLIQISKSNFYLQSNDFVKGQSGLKFDLLSNPGIEAYGKFTLYATSDNNDFISIDTTVSQSEAVLSINNLFYIDWKGITTIVTDKDTVYGYTLRFKDFVTNAVVGLGSSRESIFEKNTDAIMSEVSLGANDYLIGRTGVVSNNFYPLATGNNITFTLVKGHISITDGTAQASTLSPNSISSQKILCDTLRYNKLAFGESNSEYYSISIIDEINTSDNGIYTNVLTFNGLIDEGSAAIYANGFLSFSVMTNYIGALDYKNIQISSSTIFNKDITVKGTSTFKDNVTIPYKVYSASTVVSDNAASEGWVRSWAQQEVQGPMSQLNDKITNAQNEIINIKNNYATTKYVDDKISELITTYVAKINDLEEDKEALNKAVSDLSWDNQILTFKVGQLEDQIDTMYTYDQLLEAKDQAYDAGYAKGKNDGMNGVE